MDIQRAKTVTDREDEGIVVFIKDEKGDQAYKENPDGTPFLDENQKKVPVKVCVAGTYSKRFKTARQKQRDRNLRKLRGDSTAESLERQEVTVTAECILWWDGFTIAGQEFPFNTENAVMLLEGLPWVRDQIEAKQSDHASFSSAPSIN